MKLLTLIRYDLKNYFYSKTAFLAMILLPILVIAAAVGISTTLLVNSSFIEPMVLVMVDQEDSFYTNFFVEKILQTPSLQDNIEIIQTSEEEGTQLLKENKAAGMVIIPAEFTSKMQESIFLPIKVIGNYNKPLEATMIKEGMQSATNLMSAAQSGVFTITHYSLEAGVGQEEFDRIFQQSALTLSSKALGRDQMFSETIKTPWFDMEANYFYFASLLVFFISLYGLQGIYLYINQRDHQLITRMKTMGISLWHIASGKYLSLTIFLFIQSSIILYLCQALKFFRLKGDMKLGLLVLLLICSCISALTLLMAAFSKNHYIGSMLVFIVSLLGVFLGGGIIPYAYMPNSLASLGKFTFNHWSVQGLIYSLFTNEADIAWQSLGLLGLLTVIFLSGLVIKLTWEEKNI